MSEEVKEEDAVKVANADRDELIRDIRSRLPLVAIGHPALAAEIERALVIVEKEHDPAEQDRRARAALDYMEVLRKLADTTTTELRVGTVVRGFEGGRQWLGIVVQIGDEDDGHDGAVLVHMEDGPGYPCWWASWVVVPVAALAES